MRPVGPAIGEPPSRAIAVVAKVYGEVCTPKDRHSSSCAGASKKRLRLTEVVGMSACAPSVPLAPVSEPSLAEAEAALKQTRYDLCIVDLKLEGASGLEVLRTMRSSNPDTAAIVITAHGSVEAAVQAMRLGAYDFVKKPFELDELLASAEHALRAAALQRRVDYLEGRERSKNEGLIRCSSLPMQRLEAEIQQVAPQPIPVVLLVGETGAGKGLVARRLHFGSPRANGPFVELNAAAVPETLIESELFGHERGAFSDAHERKQGLFEVADGGTLFLDEVGDLGQGAQAKLLTFLESFTFRRVGATAVRTVDVRVVAATNRDLRALTKEGRFRADLFYRLSPITLRVPPLRDRVEDIAPFSAHFLSQAAQRFHKAFPHRRRPDAEDPRAMALAGQRAGAEGGHRASGAHERRHGARASASATRVARRGRRRAPLRDHGGLAPDAGGRGAALHAARAGALRWEQATRRCSARHHAADAGEATRRGGVRRRP